MWTELSNMSFQLKGSIRYPHQWVKKGWRWGTPKDLTVVREEKNGSNYKERHIKWQTLIDQKTDWFIFIKIWEQNERKAVLGCPMSPFHHRQSGDKMLECGLKEFMFIKQHLRQEVVSNAVNEELVSLRMRTHLGQDMALAAACSSLGRTQDSMYESE